MNRRTRNTGDESPVELGTRPGPVTKIRYRWVCERPVSLLLNLGSRSRVTIYGYMAEPMLSLIIRFFNISDFKSVINMNFRLVWRLPGGFYKFVYHQWCDPLGQRRDVHLFFHEKFAASRLFSGHSAGILRS